MKTIALLSGKGGSGKTTLGLTISSLLAKAQLKVLLIDCDMATHGATYFFEEQLPNNELALSFYDIAQMAKSNGTLLEEPEFENLLFHHWDIQLSQRGVYEMPPATAFSIKVDENFHFIPSIKRVGEDFKSDEGEFRNSFSIVLKSFVNFLERMYDVVIFDCQAGYSFIFPSLLPMINSTLMVLEPDKVSTIALRSLYKMIGEYLPNKDVYQVFNKVAKDEREFYEKITFETFFINVGALLYDWSIRRAFAFCRIPDIEDNGMEFGQQLCDLCNNIIVDSSIRDKINRYSKTLLLKKKNEEYDLLRRTLNKQKAQLSENKSMKGRIKKFIKDMSPFILGLIIMVFTFIGIATVLLSYLLRYIDTQQGSIDTQGTLGLIIIPIFCFTLMLFTWLAKLFSGETQRDQIKETYKNLEMLGEEINKLKEAIDEDMKSSLSDISNSKKNSMMK